MLVSVFCLVLLGSNAFAQEYTPPKEDRGMAGGMCQPAAWDTFEGSWLIGHYVMDIQSRRLGQISNLVIENTNGHIALVVLSDVPNLGHQELAVPYGSIMRTGQDNCTFNPGNMVMEETSGVYGPGLYGLTRAPSTSKLYGIPSAIDLAWVSYLYQLYGKEPYWTDKGAQPQEAMQFQFYESTRLMGAAVHTPKDEEVARVNNLVIDSSEGHIAFVVLSDVAGRGDDLVAVPSSAFSESGENFFVLNTTKEQLASARSFDEHADVRNLEYAADVYRYFGQQPYWREEEGW